MVALMTKVAERFRSYPRVGWVCQGIEDRGEVSDWCDKCGTAIRYVHVLGHNEVSEIVYVGCVCASKMEADEAAAPEREKWFRKVRTWNWRLSARGNRYRNISAGVYALNIVLAETPDGSRVRVTNRANNDSVAHTFATEDRALGWLAVTLEQLSSRKASPEEQRAAEAGEIYGDEQVA